MTEEVDQQPEVEAEAEGPRCGERLAAAREELSISIAEIAKELHIDEQKVAALENNDFSPLGAPVFAKGHLRKYAQLVKVNIDDILTDYHRLTRSEGLPPVVSNRKAPKLPASPTPWIVAVLLVVVAAAAGAVYWYLFRAVDAPATETLRPEAAVEQDAALPASLPPPTTAPASIVRPPADDVTAPAQAEAGAATSAASSAGTDKVAASDSVRLTIRFSGDCWTEISDGDGRRLFFDLGREGRTINLTGREPLSVLFGNAANVELTVNGSSFEIPASGRRGQTARFRLFATS